MSQAETLQDLYSKIADIYDKICNLSSDSVTAIQSGITINETSWQAPQIYLQNPNNDEAISLAQQQINNLLNNTFVVLQSAETEYQSQFGDGSIVPVPKGSPIMLLPKLIAVLVLYRAPVRFLATLIVDFIKEILLEEIKRKVTRRPNIIYGSVTVTNAARFQIPTNAEKLIIVCTGIPSWISKRFDRVYNGQNDKFLKGLGSVSLGFKGVASSDIFWTCDYKIEYAKQSIDLFEIRNMNDRYGYMFLESQITAQIRFV